MTRVLLVGSGAREHAIASSLAKSSNVELYAAMSTLNPGIMKLSKNASTMKITDPVAVSDYAKACRIELAVVGPEAPLVSGVVNTLREHGIMCVGPTRELARLEGDKTFCRELMSKYRIAGNPQFRVFTELDDAEAFLKKTGPVAIKPAGLTGGKGVKVSGEDLPNKQAETTYAREILQGKIGGFGKLVVEEKLDGEEYSLQVFVDGNNVYPMPLVQDHKRAYENDTGPNTGGMGSYSDNDHLLPFVSKSQLEVSLQIMRDTVQALGKEVGDAYRGILYGQFMLAKGLEENTPSPKLIEFNCRFGDPEAMNVLPLLSDKVSFLDICERVADGTLRSEHIAFEHKATVCKYLVPSTYPESASSGQAFFVDEDSIAKCGSLLYYASVDVVDEQTVTTNSRTTAVLGIRETLEEAERVSEEATWYVKGALRHRRDIGTAELIRKRVEHLRALELTPEIMQGSLLTGIV